MSMFPLAIYTAKHGLEWTYPKGEIDYVTLDKCRKIFGGLPDFDAGEPGFDGVWITENLVFVARCQSVANWDFRGRDATYMAVTWMSRDKAKGVDVEALLSSPSLSKPSHEECLFFEGSFMSMRGATFGNLSQLLDENCQSFILRRSFGETTVRTKIFESVTRTTNAMSANIPYERSYGPMPKPSMYDMEHSCRQMPLASSTNPILSVVIGSIIAFFMATIISIGVTYFFLNNKIATLEQDIQKDLSSLRECVGIIEMKEDILDNSKPKNPTQDIKNNATIEESSMPSSALEENSTKEAQALPQVDKNLSKEDASKEESQTLEGRDKFDESVKTGRFDVMNQDEKGKLKNVPSKNKIKKDVRDLE